MRFFRTILALATAFFTISAAKPLPPARLDEIERRWSQGESEQSIHAQHTYRDATPAWPIARGPLNDEYSWDARTAEKRNGRRRAVGESVSPLAKMKTYVELVYRGVGLDDRARQIGEAPVLQPRNGMVYDYTD